MMRWWPVWRDILIIVLNRFVYISFEWISILLQLGFVQVTTTTSTGCVNVPLLHHLLHHLKWRTNRTLVIRESQPLPTTLSLSQVAGCWLSVRFKKAKSDFIVTCEFAVLWREKSSILNADWLAQCCRYTCLYCVQLRCRSCTYTENAMFMDHMDIRW